MSVFQDYDQALTAYTQAVRSLYQAPQGVEATADRSAGEIYAERLDASGEAVTAQAAAVRQALSGAQQSEDLAVRELASLKLMTLALNDLTVASDLLELAQTKPGDEPDRSARGLVQADEDLRSVLEAPLAGGMGALLEVDRGALPTDPAAARAELERTAHEYLKNVPEDAAELSQTALSGVVTLGFVPAQGALSLAAQEILARLPDGATPIARQAAKIVAEAIEKVRAALGKENEDQIQEQAAAWLKDLQDKRDTVTALLDKVYETGRIGGEVDEKIKQAAANLEAARFNQASSALQTKQEASKKTRKVLNGLMRLLAVVKAPLMAVPPWGTLAVYTVYLCVLAYAVYSGGDYLDWYRTGKLTWLDRVEGIRTTVSKAVS